MPAAIFYVLQTIPAFLNMILSIYMDISDEEFLIIEE
jgi:hypothetical protein